MRRFWPLWTAFILCLAVAAAAMGWISVTALRLDEAEAKARHQAALEENVRLALWRIDSTLSPILAQESARPYIAYRTPTPPFQEQANVQNRRPGEIVSSPLPATASPLVLVHFQIEPDGRITSPEASVSEPAGATTRSDALRTAISNASGAETRKQLARIAKLTDRDRLSTLLPPDPASGTHMMIAQSRSFNDNRYQPGGKEVVRSDRGAAEFQRRSQIVTSNGAAMVESQLANNVGNFTQQAPGWNGSQYAGNRNAAPAAGMPETPDLGILSNATIGNQNSAGSGLVQLPASAPSLNNGVNLGAVPQSNLNDGLAALNPFQTHANEFNSAPSPTEMGGGLMTPLWINGELFLVRRIAVNGRDYFQGCLLDWPATKALLLDTIGDLLPHADLMPVTPEAAADESRMLAALPLRLVAGPIATAGKEVLSPIRWILPVAWISVALAAIAVATLLASVIRLGQRRADFVSAVTHELRTPLTTFHMYTEMLSEGMVSDPAQQRSYFDTLRAEASRLSHLVENVLAYARLERKRINGLEPVTVARVLECRNRLADRARQAGMELVVEANEPDLSVSVGTNPSVVEQILFNLVDNACKYAATAEDKQIRLVVEPTDRGVVLKICDRGPGLPRAAARKLFRAFSKSPQEAATTAPGIGLGLALSKRLARDIGGRLRHEPSKPCGTTFVLFLPRA